MNKDLKKIILAALYIALGLVLPFVFHAVPSGGTIFLPMHIPVILAGLTIGVLYSVLVGLLTPILSFFLTNMPTSVVLPGMTLELITYALACSLLIKVIKTKYSYLNVYLTLIIAMLLGRAVSGLTNAFIFQAGTYTFKTWVSLSFVTAIPGIIIQLVLIPNLYVLFKKYLLKDIMK